LCLRCRGAGASWSPVSAPDTPSVWTVADPGQNKLNIGTYMNRKNSLKCLGAVLISAALSLPAFAADQDAPKKDEKQPSEADMMEMMMKLAKPGENHKLLEGIVGTWTYKVKWWMSPEAPPSESAGTTIGRAVMGGRYFISDHTGKMQMPGPEGKMMDMEFKGMAVEGYDNVKKKFVASWIDNMGTGIMNSEGTYDADAKTFTFVAEYEPMPGMKTKMRQLIKIIDKNHRAMEFFEDRGGKEVKTMEINYARNS
jgi:hypothetical protein